MVNQENHWPDSDFIKPRGIIPSGSGSTSSSPFPFQPDRQSAFDPVEIHHQFNCCFRQKGKGNVRGMVSAGNLQ
ncbi:MAG: hypothetical protein OXH65_03375 [Paracoccaceae bacterium]|nr:hypothetical protein [Paracoccaceae bacterium]